MLDGQIVFTAIRIRDLKFYGVDKKDLDGIVQELRSIRGVHTAIFLYETAPFVWKVSLRSDEKVDVASIAARFGGGGHKRAAGCTLSGNMYDVVNSITPHIEEQLKADV